MFFWRRKTKNNLLVSSNNINKTEIGLKNILERTTPVLTHVSLDVSESCSFLIRFKSRSGVYVWDHTCVHHYLFCFKWRTKIMASYEISASLRTFAQHTVKYPIFYSFYVDKFEVKHSQCCQNSTKNLVDILKISW